MKNILTILVMAALPTLAVAQGSISLDVKQMAAKASSSNSYPTWWGSYDKSYQRQRDISVTVKTLAREPQEVAARVFWVGRPIAGGPRRVIKQEPRQQILQPMIEWQFYSSSGHVAGSDLNLALANYRQTSGAKIDGWVVAVEHVKTRQIVAVRGSDHVMEDLIRSGRLTAANSGSSIPDVAPGAAARSDPMRPDRR